MCKTEKIKAIHQPIQSRKRWNAIIFTVIGAKITAPNADHLLNINIKPDKKKTICIRYNKYPVANNAPRKAIPASLNCGGGSN